jgi:hypothetical protein
MRYTHFSKIERLELSILLKKGYSLRDIVCLSVALRGKMYGTLFGSIIHHYCKSVKGV